MKMLYQNILFSKAFLAYIGCFSGLLTHFMPLFSLFSDVVRAYQKRSVSRNGLNKLKRGLGLAFLAHFLHTFSTKMSQPFDQVSISGLISFPRYQTMFFNFCLVNWLRQSFIFNHLLEQWLTGGSRGEEGNTKTWISWEQKTLYEKPFFISF